MINAALLALIEDAGTAILTLTEEVQEAEFLNSRLTRQECLRQLRQMADSLAALPPPLRQRMPEIEWDAWSALNAPLGDSGPGHEQALWFGCRSLAPATLLWLRVYREGQPELFK